MKTLRFYFNLLKENGLTYAANAQESLEVDEFGTMSWYGVNSDKSFTVWVNFFAEEQKIDDIPYDTGKQL